MFMDMALFLEELDGLFAAKKFKEAGEYLFSGLERAERENDREAELSICNELGGYCRVTARFEEGVKVFEKAMRAIDALGLCGTEHEATTMLNYATLSVHSGKPEQALEQYRVAEKIYAELNPGSDYRVAALNNNMASMYIRLHDYEKAAKCAERALEIMELTGTDSDEIAVTLSLKAQIYAGLGEYEKAFDELKKAEAAYAGVKDPGVMHTAVTCATFGEVCGKLGKYAQAGGYYEKALSLIEQNFGRNLHYASVLRGFAACKGAQGDREGESKYISEAELIEKASG